MLAFLQHASLSPDAACLLVAFCLASWFSDCLPVAPLLYLLGPHNETALVLRLLGCLCRRPVLLSDVDVPALATLPSHLEPTSSDRSAQSSATGYTEVRWHPIIITSLSRAEIVNFMLMGRRLFRWILNLCTISVCE